MDWSFLLGFLPALTIVFVCVVAFVRRRRRGSPLIVNPYTLVVEPVGKALGPSVEEPTSLTTTSQPYRVPTPQEFAAIERQLDERDGQLRLR